ncbi:asparaginase [Vreelandella massiliensis]|uniref:asparaginase n=1 Tax=Vreelandella massiliensis TaxID=1816686 RepID=UPI00096A6836|nr:asparaginase [Halomonas massiliensis]MYL24599.1 asparaginase [Halomonas alkaliantarctica]
MSISSPLADCAPSEERILIIYTGGTIGMEVSSKGLLPAGHFDKRLDQALTQLSLPERGRLPVFDLMSYPTPIDSSTATPANWQQIATDIDTRLSDYRGFVILHGTDTLSWTAASLAYQLQGIDRPVVVTGAMQPLGVANSDALENIQGALHFAAQPALQEVAIYFAGQLFRGVRAVKQHTEAPEAFASPNYPRLGARVEEDFVYYPSRGLPHQQRGAPRFELPSYSHLAQGEVIRVTLWPGMAAWQLAAWLNDDRVRGALLELWGAGNIANDPDILAAIAAASGEGKLIAAISQAPQGSVHLGAYAAGHELVEAGVLSGDGMTPEAAYTKLIHLLAQPLTEAERRQQFVTSLVGER